MAKFSLKQRFLLAAIVAIPVAIFFAARSAVSWQPQLIGVQPSAKSFMKSANQLLLSPDEHKLVAWNGNNREGYEWNLLTGAKRKLQGYRGIYSQDSHWLVARSRLTKIYVYSPTGLQWQREFALNADYISVSFGRKNELIVTTNHGSRAFDPNTGQEIKLLPNSLNWVRLYRDDYVTPPLTPDKKRLKWICQNFERFDIVDAQTQQKLWSYAVSRLDGGMYFCNPRFEEDGKSLVTIENNSIVVRDSRTGKIIFSHKNNLSWPLKAWAFTKDRSAVYLLDAKGEIFRQRLR
ncbi:hypothetical protein IAD21_01542 [Abditibacteriota bacterium]|nr:hypothetical protein IAD21_01542 [Abditibacteriota bacterium]